MGARASWDRPPAWHHVAALFTIGVRSLPGFFLEVQPPCCTRRLGKGPPSTRQGRFGRFAFGRLYLPETSSKGLEGPALELEVSQVSRLSRSQRFEGSEQIFNVCTCKSFVDLILHTNPRESRVEAGKGLRYPLCAAQILFFV